jgi:hypothetical protein
MHENASFEVWAPGHPGTETLRGVFRARMSRRYDGWNDAYDRQFDDHSFLFVRRDAHGEYLATCRLVFKRIRGRTHALPMELADVSSFSPSPEYQRCCEGGMISFTSRPHALALMYGVTIWLVENDVDLCLTTYDVSNPLMQRLFTRTLGFSLVDAGVACYSGFTWKDNGEPVPWQVVQATRPSAQGVLERLTAAGVQPCRQADAPRLDDWM